MFFSKALNERHAVLDMDNPFISNVVNDGHNNAVSDGVNGSGVDPNTQPFYEYQHRRKSYKKRGTSRH